MIKKCIIFLFSLFLPLLFLPVQNTYAASYNYKSRAIGLRNPDNNSELVLKWFNNGATQTTLGPALFFDSTSSDWTYLRIHFNPFSVGKYRDFSLSFIVSSNSYSNGLGAINVHGAYNLNTTVTPISDLTYTQVVGTMGYAIEQTYYVNITGTLDASNNGNTISSLDLYWGTSSSPFIILQPELVITDNATTLKHFDYLETIINSLQSGNQAIINSQDDTTDSVNNLNNTIVQQQQAENNAMNNSQNSADSSAESSGAQAEAQGTTLLQILQGFASAIATPSTGSCVINMDLSGYGAGNYPMDLCQLSPPPAITGLLSVVVVGFVIKAVLSTIEAMLALYKEYQS